ncbi:PspC domain-containing protein [Chloroflexus sp. MS-CIW-1]|jgi:phage shock protein C|uniref:PspC domain-containing protein n=1 Tax=Chloroflexus sp. MS-CIW-1 TaxID=3055768 RepID=UPI002648C169|nr:PspC domain-containing protein [Chloroflexus sp. MS-CIW-1]MDN5273247.1 PspC domain-containing protein [Chloroflexus sp. MS-CIW-1]
MNTPQTRRLQRTRSDRMIAGVAGGLAKYLGIDPVIMRIAFVIVGLMNGIGVVIYLVLWLLMPNEDAESTTNNLDVAIDEMRAMIEQLVARIRDLFR